MSKDQDQMNTKDQKVTSKKVEKKKKPKGPIRTEAIVPTLLLFLILFLYFFFFFDSHLRWGLEYAGTKAVGAEVNIGHLSTSFTKAKVSLGKIQITNPKKPTHNIAEVSKITFQALWKGLLRGKVVIPETSVSGIQVNTERKYKGRVLPVTDDSNSMVKTMQKDALAETEKTLEGNIFGDLAQVLGGMDHKEKLKNMKGELKSNQYIKDLTAQLKEKEVEWKKRIESLPKSEDFKRIEKDIKSIKINGKDPASILAATKKADQLYKEIKSNLDNVKTTNSTLKKDLNSYKNLYGQINKYIDQDMTDLQSKMGIPSLDPKEIAMKVFGRQVKSQIQGIEKYIRMARKYMPPPKEKKEPVVKRANGRDFKFPKKNSYPQLWLQKVSISSKISEEGFSGDVHGTINNITDNPKHLGKPVDIEIKGEFPKSDIHGALISAVIDHTTNSPKEYGSLKVATFPLKDVKLSKSSDLTYGFQKAIGTSKLNFKIENEQIKLDMNNLFNKINYLVETKDPKVKKTLLSLSQKLGEVDLSGSITGSWLSPKIRLNSNLGKKFQAALKKQVSAEINKYKAELKAKITDRIATEKQKLTSKLGDIESKIGVSLKDKESAANSLRSKLDEEKKKFKQKQKDKLKEEGKKLLKKLKFKF